MANPQLGYRLVGTIKSIKGTCNAGHKVGDVIELSAHSSGGLCGFFYHDIFGDIVMMQFGGKYPWAQNPDVMMRRCRDRNNEVDMELRRVGEARS